MYIYIYMCIAVVDICYIHRYRGIYSCFRLTIKNCICISIQLFYVRFIHAVGLQGLLFRAHVRMAGGVQRSGGYTVPTWEYLGSLVPSVSGFEAKPQTLKAEP